MRKENKKRKTNYVSVTGEVMDDFKYSHQVGSDIYLQTKLLVERKSGKIDIIPLISPQKLIKEKFKKGARINVKGQCRSFMEKEDNKNHLKVFVFCYWMENSNALNEDDNNEFEAEGYICREPVYKKTKKGREIADFMIAINRHNGKTDYIPCIAWGYYAELVTFGLGIGSKINICGRIQSRVYHRYLENNKELYKEVYEVSINQIE